MRKNVRDSDQHWHPPPNAGISGLGFAHALVQRAKEEKFSPNLGVSKASEREKQRRTEQTIAAGSVSAIDFHSAQISDKTLAKPLPAVRRKYEKSINKSIYEHQLRPVDSDP